MTTAKVSIITPVYNSERFVNAFLSNVFVETFANIELVIIDDGSQDKTVPLIDAFIRKNPETSIKVKILHQKHGGPGSARQLGMEQATGEFLYFADADDAFHPSLIERCVEVLERTDADFVYFDYRSVTKKVEFESLASNSSYTIMTSREYGLAGVDRPEDVAFGYLWNKMFRTKKLRDWRLSFPPINTEEDAIFLFDLYAHSHSVAHIDAVLYQYVHNPASITHARRDLSSFAHNLRLRCDATQELLSDVWKFSNNSLQSRVYIRYFIASIELLLSERGGVLSGTVAWHKLKKDPYFEDAIKYIRDVPRLSNTADKLVMLLVNMRMDLILVVLVKLIGRHG